MGEEGSGLVARETQIQRAFVIFKSLPDSIQPLELMPCGYAARDWMAWLDQLAMPASEKSRWGDILPHS